MADPALSRILLKTVLALPDPLLRAVAGGGVVYRGGRTLDPKFQFLSRAWFNPAAMGELEPADARAGWSDLVAAMGLKPAKSVKSETVLLDGPAGALTTRLYRPADQDVDAPMLLYFHGGGGVVGDLDDSDGFCGLLAQTGRCAVLAPDYRLAPEDRFPAGFEDAQAAWTWACANAERYGALGVAVGGESVGAAFAAALCQVQRAEGGAQPVFQLLICPLIDAATGDSRSTEIYGDAWPLNQAALEWILSHYLGPDGDPGDPRLSPLRTEDLTGLAPAVVVTGGFDLLADQAEAYARRLKTAGVATVYRRYDRLPHGFIAFAGVVPAAAAAAEDVAALVRQAIDGRPRA